MNHRQIVLTNDGTNTLHSTQFDECYHSTTDGALNETLNKHIIPAFTLSQIKEKITILDICYGLGYNTLATIYYCKLHKINSKIEIISPEFDEVLVKSLVNFEYPKEFETLRDIIISLSENYFYEDEQFKITIIIGDAREQLPKITTKFDIIYQDAFSPTKNPTLWTREYFELLYKLSNNGVVMTTYSSATSVRMGMWEAGFSLYNPQKSSVRSGTIASKSNLNLEIIDMELKQQRNPNAKSIRD
jgi:tRNA U34 5-methylaminomethyl-2-thiouridine-forming methyltransferase MnmC